MYTFPSFEPLCSSMSGSNSCFLTSIQISQEAGKVVWYFHLFKNFPQFILIHIVKGFSIVNEAEIDVFLEFSCFFYDPRKLAIWSLVPLPFLNPTWTSGISKFTYCWSLAWRTLSITLLACEMSAAVWWFEHSLALLFFGIGLKTYLFQSCDQCWFSKFAGIWRASLSQHHVRIWNSSAGISSLPLESLWTKLWSYLKINLLDHAGPLKLSFTQSPHSRATERKKL